MTVSSTKTFSFVYNGLNLEVVATDLGSGQTSFAIKCLNGYADINALYWNDGDATANEGSLIGFGGKDSSLNMNGSGEAWDGGIKLSDTGLGQKAFDGTSGAANKTTYLTAGEGPLVKTVAVDWNTLDTLGVRATSTSTKEGSIKGVDDCAVIKTPPPPLVEKQGDLLWVENFDNYAGADANGSWGIVNLTQGSPMQPDGQVHYWAVKTGPGPSDWGTATGELVKGNAFDGSIAGTSTQGGNDFWLDTQNSPGGINIHNNSRQPCIGRRR